MNQIYQAWLRQPEKFKAILFHGTGLIILLAILWFQG